MAEAGLIKEKIELVLLQNGCTEFMYGWKDEHAQVQFHINGKRYRIALKMPNKKDFYRTPTGKTRAYDVAIKEWQLAQTDIWRALLSIVETNFNFVRMGASTIEKQFLAFIVLPDGQLAGDYAETMINDAYEESVRLLNSGNLPS